MAKTAKVLCFRINDEKDLVHVFWCFSQGYFFRGHADAQWRLQTTLERKYSEYHQESLRTGIQEHRIAKDVEKYFSNAFSKDLTLSGEYNAIQKYRCLSSPPISMEKLKNVEVLAKMQHYGAATRLLDVTTSFLIALFFAFEGHNDKDRAVWVFNRNYFYRNSGLIQPRTNFDTEAEKERIFSELIKNDDDLCKNSINYADEFIYNPQKETDDKKTLIPLEITGNNPRLIAQNGAFLFPSILNKSFEENLCSVLNMGMEDFSAACNKIQRKRIRNENNLTLINAAVIKLVFPVNIRHLAERLFQAANISYQSIYPDEIGIAKSIKYW